jgi:hypothetical protein
MRSDDPSDQPDCSSNSSRYRYNDIASLIDTYAFDLRNCLAIEPLLLSDLKHEHDLSIVSVEVREERPRTANGSFAG